MRCIGTIVLLTFGLFLRSQPIGSWREHLPYNSTIDLASAPDRIFAATPYSLFSIGKSDGRIVKYSKIDGLSETGIQAIHFDIPTDNLLVAYTNSNLDLLTPNDKINIPDLKRATGVGDKTIRSIAFINGKYHLSTGLGIVVVDPVRALVTETWRLGSNGASIPVNQLAFDLTHYYAATTEGLKSIARSNPNPANANNWQLLSGNNGLPAGACSFAGSLGNSIVAIVRDTVYQRVNNQWTIFQSGDWPLVSARISEDKLLLCQRNQNGQSRLLILNPDGTTYRLLAQLVAISFPKQAMLVNGEPWLADLYAGLTRFPGSGSYQSYSVNGPQGLASGQLLTLDGNLYATAGSVNASWNYLYNGDGLYAYREGLWNNYNRYRYPLLDSVLDWITLTSDKRDGSLWAGSYGGGLIQLKSDGAIRLFNRVRCYRQWVIQLVIGYRDWPLTQSKIFGFPISVRIVRWVFAHGIATGCILLCLFRSLGMHFLRSRSIHSDTSGSCHPKEMD